MSILLKITSSGQISIPARIRRQWNTTRVFADEVEGGILVRPAPDDPIDAAFGMLRDRTNRDPRTAVEIVRAERNREVELELEDS